MNKISELILLAIDTLTDEKLSHLRYDRTIATEIYSLENANTGEYKVRYLGNIFLAYSDDLETVYKVGDAVYVVVPEGDFSNRKIISGYITLNSMSDVLLTELANTIVEISPTFDQFYGYNTTREIGVVAGASTPAQGSLTYIYGPISSYTRSSANDRFQSYAKEYEYIKIEASFLTTFHQTHIKGNYGVEVEFFTKEAGTTVRYILDHNAFNGDPYSLSVYSPQYVIVKVLTNYLQGVKGIRLFEEDFEYDLLPSTRQRITTPNIFCKDVKIQYVEKRDLTDTTYYLTISPLDGNAFTSTNRSLRLQGQLIYQGLNVLTSKSCDCTWFERDLSVMPGDSGYDKDVGFGWKQITSSTTLTINGGLLTLTNSDTLYHQLKYKLKVVYNDLVTTTALIEIFNLRNDYEYHLEQITTNDNIELQLIADSSISNLSGVWYYSYPDGTYIAFNGSVKYPSIEVKNILLYSAVTFYCSVYSGSRYLGTLEHTIFNSESQEDLIVSYAGEDTFKYDANGDITVEDSERDRNLTVHLAWKEGIGTSYTILWLMRDASNNEVALPESYTTRFNPDASMLEGVWLDTTLNLLHYHIKLKYKINFTNNALIIKITTLDLKIYTFEKEILFTKDGDQGTNGTTYIVAIRPFTLVNNVPVKLTGFLALRYQNGVWSNPLSLYCYVYKDGELINNNSRYKISYKWDGIHVTLNGAAQAKNQDRVTCRGTGAADTDHYVKVLVDIEDGINEQGSNTIYAYYPIDVAVGSITLGSVDIENIPSYIKYTSTGIIPSTYSNNIVFNYAGTKYQNTLTTKYITSLNENLLEINDVQENGTWYSYLQPATSFIFSNDGSTDIAVVKCRTSNSSVYILHSIVMYLDTYGNEAINGWDGTSIETDNGHIFAPLIGAGEKDSANRFTGVVMGKDSGQDGNIGLYGYNHGINTFGLMQNGKAYFGAAGQGGRITLDGQYATIYGGDASVDNRGNVTYAENGMVLVLADRSDRTTRNTDGSLQVKSTTVAIAIGKGEITSGLRTTQHGNFEVNYGGEVIMRKATVNGHLYAEDGRIGGSDVDRDKNGWIIATNLLYSGDGTQRVALYSGKEATYKAPKEKASDEDSYFRIWAGGNDPTSFKTPFRVTSKGVVYMSEADITGTIYATGGLIGCTFNKDTGARTGGWLITADLISSTKDSDDSAAVYLNSGITGRNGHRATSRTYGGRSIMNQGYYRIWAGNSEPNSAPFAVTSTGWVFASNALINGIIYAQLGLIGSDDKGEGGWTIATNTINSGSGSEHVEINSGTELAPALSVSSTGKISKSSSSAEDKGYVRIWAGGARPTNAKFFVTNKGIVYMQDAYIEATINSEEGNIGGWTLESQTLHTIPGTNGRSTGLANKGDIALWVRGKVTVGSSGANGDPTTDNASTALTSDAEYNDCYFYVTSSGKLYCQGATIKGSVTAGKGEIGGWKITTNRLESAKNQNVWLSTTGGASFGHFIVSTAGALSITDDEGKTPFRVTANGKLSATGADIEGSIKAGGWTLSNGSLKNEGNTVYINSSGAAKFGENFTVSSGGNITAKNVNISGTINADGGSIGGWTITTTQIKSKNTTLDGSTGIITANYFAIGSMGYVGDLYAAPSTATHGLGIYSSGSGNAGRALLIGNSGAVVRADSGNAMIQGYGTVRLQYGAYTSKPYIVLDSSGIHFYTDSPSDQSGIYARFA